MQLKVYKNGKRLFTHPSESTWLTIGSADHCDICLPDADIHAVHYVLYRDAGLWWLAPTQSWQQTSRLKSGQTLDMGPYAIQIQNEHSTLEQRTGTLTTAVQRSHTTSIHLCHDDQQHLVDATGLVIGTDQHADLVLNDDFVSRHHVRIYKSGQGIRIQDLGSSNGTFINRARIEKAEVYHDCILQAGQTEMHIRIESTPDTIQDPQHILSPAMTETLRIAQKAAPSDLSILITGETGTGKEVMAQFIAEHSNRKNQPIISVNCGALNRDLIASELFGHEKGAFTGAVSKRSGVFRQAHGGTLFLDEIGELPLEHQVRLLRVLETGEVCPLGSERHYKVDVRIIAATHRDLVHMIRQGLFREDLYHRLAMLTLHLCPLRERTEEIPGLVQTFLSQFQVPHIQLTQQAMRTLQTHTWPGNIRELRNVLQRAIALRESDILTEYDWLLSSSLAITLSDQKRFLDQPLIDLERRAIEKHLINAKGNRSQAAATLGIGRATLHRRIESLDIDIDALLESHNHPLRAPRL